MTKLQIHTLFKALFFIEIIFGMRFALCIGIGREVYKKAQCWVDRLNL